MGKCGAVDALLGWTRLLDEANCTLGIIVIRIAVVRMVMIMTMRMMTATIIIVAFSSE